MATHSSILPWRNAWTCQATPSMVGVSKKLDTTEGT